MGIDTPESRTRDKVEKAFGLASKNRARELMPVGSTITLKTFKGRGGEDAKGKFGRILGDFYIEKEGKLFTEIMVEEGHAVAYHGQAKEDVHDEHMRNRERLLTEGTVVLPDND